MSGTEVINSVRLKGKVSKVTPLRYTPTGTALLEVVVGVAQEFLGERSVGYFDVLYSRNQAIERAREIRVGHTVEIEGCLWSRRYQDRSGSWIVERKVIVD